MLHQRDSETQTPPAGWKTVTLIGGPHHRTRINLHDNEDSIVLHDGPDAHRYLRVSGKPELHHESRVAAAFGGGR